MARRKDREKEQPAQKDDFYSLALKESERVLLEEARKLEGLDEEIALLRVKLNSLIANDPEDTKNFLKGIELLTKAVAARYRLSQKAEDDLYENILGVLRGIGGMMWPEVFDGV